MERSIMEKKYIIKDARNTLAHQLETTGITEKTPMSESPITNARRLEIVCLLAFGLQFLGRVECDVCLARIEQLFHVSLVDVAAFALSVRAVIASERYTFVKLDAEPSERFDYVFFGSGNETVGVGVLNAEYQIAAVLTGKQIVVQCGAYSTDMQGPRRAWCEAHPYSSFRH